MPIWKDVAKGLQGIVNVAAVDADKHKELAGETFLLISLYLLQMMGLFQIRIQYHWQVAHSQPAHTTIGSLKSMHALSPVWSDLYNCKL